MGGRYQIKYESKWRDGQVGFDLTGFGLWVVGIMIS